MKRPGFFERIRRRREVERRQAACSHLFAHFDREIGPGVLLRTSACGLCGKKTGEEYAVIMPEAWPLLRALGEALPKVTLETLAGLLEAKAIDKLTEAPEEREPRP